MFFFNRSETYGVLAYVTSGHVLFIEARSRTPVAFVDVGEQAHAAFPAANEQYVIVANQNGKKVHRILTDYSNGIFAADNAATLDLATGTTPNGVPKEDALIRLTMLRFVSTWIPAASLPLSHFVVAASSSLTSRRRRCGLSRNTTRMWSIQMDASASKRQENYTSIQGAVQPQIHTNWTCTLSARVVLS